MDIRQKHHEKSCQAHHIKIRYQFKQQQNHILNSRKSVKIQPIKQVFANLTVTCIRFIFEDTYI